MSEYTSGSFPLPGALPGAAQASGPQEPVEPSLAIKLDGEVIGVLYPRRLPGAAQLDIEDAQTTRQVIAWMQKYASGDPRKIEAKLRELPLAEVTTFVRTVAEAMRQAIALGNASGPR